MMQAKIRAADPTSPTLPAAMPGAAASRPLLPRQAQMHNYLLIGMPVGIPKSPRAPPE